MNGVKQGRYRLSKAERILKSHDFKQVFKRGKRIRFPEFTLVVATNDLEYSRLGIGIGRRFGKSVYRNRAKRLCRELFRLNKYKLPAGVDVVFLPRPRLLKASWQELQGRMVDAGKIIARKINT
ncbi:MAG: ribonuclease P protein component [Thermodesulfobacteria bacterium]|nr:ribonuclease P protein component [Thermodesulfobacteriota bacterium]